MSDHQMLPAYPLSQTFEATHNQEDWKLSPQSLEQFVTLWSQYDDGSGTITPK